MSSSYCSYRSGRGGGKRPWEKDPRSNAKMPASIVCKVCNKSKPNSQFAQSQLRKLEGSRGSQPGIACLSCNTGGQIQERRCDDCGDVKGRGGFSFAQFKVDDPRCLECMEGKIKIDAPTLGEVREPHPTKWESNEEEEDDDDGVALPEDEVVDGWREQARPGEAPSKFSMKAATSGSRATASSTARSNASSETKFDNLAYGGREKLEAMQSPNVPKANSRKWAKPPRSENQVPTPPPAQSGKLDMSDSDSDGGDGGDEGSGDDMADYI